MSRLPSLGFTAGMPIRLLATLVYALAAWGAVHLAASSSGPPPAAPAAAAPAPAAQVDAELAIESTYPVTGWLVRVDGRALTPVAATDHAWRAPVRLAAAGGDLTVEAARADPLAQEPCALRIRVRTPAGTSALTWWGSGFISGSGRISVHGRAGAP